MLGIVTVLSSVIYAYEVQQTSDTSGPVRVWVDYDRDGYHIRATNTSSTCYYVKVTYTYKGGSQSNVTYDYALCSDNPKAKLISIVEQITSVKISKCEPVR